MIVELATCNKQAIQVNPALSKLSLAKYRFQMTAIEDIHLPRYKGSAFHGGFGHALKKISPTWYGKLFEPGQADSGNALPKPFVLLPPLDEALVYPGGHRFECEFTLFGNATQHISICQAALEYLGNEIGLGRSAAKFRIESMQYATIDDAKFSTQAKVRIDSSPVINCEAIATSRYQATIKTLNLHFPTRLRIKSNEQLCRDQLPFKILFKRLIGRLNSLAVFYGDGELVSRLQLQTLLEKAENIKTHTHNLKWDDWNRYSGRQKQWMKFGGLLGSITYKGDLEPFIPYLALGEWGHVGGKSSFGLGKYTMD